MGDHVEGGSGTPARDPAFKDLEEAVRSGELVLFAGPGISMAAGLPGPAELAQRLAEHAKARGADAVARLAHGV